MAEASSDSWSLSSGQLATVRELFCRINDPVHMTMPDRCRSSVLISLSRSALQHQALPKAAVPRAVFGGR